VAGDGAERGGDGEAAGERRATADASGGCSVTSGAAGGRKAAGEASLERGATPLFEPADETRLDAVGLPCVHCGLCLDTCPTYRVLGTEADSPRGRIYIMESVRRGELELQGEAAQHLSGCLGCLACETACPSGVSFGRRIEEFRPLLIAQRSRAEALRKNVAQQMYVRPRLVSMGIRAAHAMDRIGLAPLRRRIRGLGLLPAAGSEEAADPSVSPLRRSRTPQPLRAKARVAVLTGCVGDQLAPELNRDTVEVLQRNGIEVVDVEGQGCCGALALHSGRTQEARDLAAANAEAFAAAGDLDFVVTTAAGCGAMMHEYAHVLAGTAAAATAASLALRCRDVSEVLVQIGIERPSRPLELGTVAYHDACHLLHARGVARPPRLLVEAATGRMPVDLGENAICCGSAGSYNLDQPALAEELGRNKARLARERGADVIAVGNIGCMMQIARHVALAGLSTRVAHPVQLLAAAYRQE